MGLIETVRALACNKDITYTGHAMNQLLTRGISTETVEKILQDNNNQLIEVQSKSHTPGKQHANDRLLVYSPEDEHDVIVISIIQENPDSEIRVITAEYVDEDVWSRLNGQNPCLVRKSGCN